MKISTTTPKTAVIAELGKRLARVRKQRGYTQEELSKAAGLGVATLRRIEEGNDAQLGSWIKLLKTLDMVAAIDQLVPETFSSPMAEVKAGKRRSLKKPSGVSQGSVVWGDEG